MSKRLKIRLSKRGKKKLIIALLVIVVLLVGGFFTLKTTVFKNKDIIKNNNKKIPDNTEIVEKPKPKLKIVNIDSKSRPYAIMINNISIARPYQSGLQDAYIIYELIAEGGITRYLALFKDQSTERVGTVRSSRHYYLDYVLENDAVYVHWGWSPQAQSDIKTLGIQNINGLTYGNTYFWKDNEIRKKGVGTEHTAYTSMEKLNAAVDKLNYRKETDKDLLLNYSIDEIDLSKRDDAIVANSIDINYSTSTKNHYDYDSENKVYKRSVNGKAQTDYITGNQYTFKNIIVYQVANSSIAGDEKGRQDLDNIGTGTGYFISNGYAVPINWKKTSRSAQTVYSYSNGEEITLNDGNCFIQIQPKGQTLNIN